MYNAGQSCCGIERVYVHWSQYKEFVQEASKLVTDYVMGDPLDAATSMGPVALPETPAHLERLVSDAIMKGGAIAAGTGKHMKDAKSQGRFFSPTIVTHTAPGMAIMREESFGPIVSVTGVQNDAEALTHMNNSDYGLTACVYTSSQDRANAMASKLQAGTVFMNRCDYLDPYLAWTGVKDTGKGCSLSSHGFRGFTRLKSYNFKVAM